MQTDFYPPRRNGTIFMVVLLFVFLAGAIWNFNRATGGQAGAAFSANLLLFAAFSLLLPVVGFRLYGLLRSSYSMYAGSLRLSWGLRVEEIPLEEITWVRTERELGYRLPIPVLSWPGAVVGLRRMRRKGVIEFLAARRRGLVLIETNRRAFAISPEDPNAFMHSFRRISEIGTLDPVHGASVRPAALVGSLWESRLPRSLAAGMLVAAAVFTAWIIFAIDPQPGLAYPLGDTGRVVNGSQLLLLPVLNGLFLLMDLLVGLFFFRREETRPLAYLLWGSSLMVSVLGLIAVLLRV
jgi:hypothetical protein